MEHLENMQRKATEWILSTNVDYQEKLCFPRLLPLCHYFEMHDLLSFKGLVENSFDFHFDDEKESVLTGKRTISNQEQQTQQNR